MLWTDLTSEEQEALHADQTELELRSLDLGVRRYKRWRREADSSRGTPEMRLIGGALDEVIPAIVDARDMVIEKGAGRGVAHWGYPMFCLPPEKLAVLALVTMINFADSMNMHISTICKTLGSHVEQEYQFEKLKQDHKKLYDVVRKKIKNWTPRQVAYMRKKVEDVERRWPLRVRYWVGAKLMELVLDNTALFDRVRYTASKRGKPRRMSKLSLKPEVRAELEKQHDDCQIIRPYYLPMVVPPSDWSDLCNGGFRYHRYPLVKPQNLMDNPIEHPMPGPKVFEAINIVQHTGWRINRRVYAVMAQVWQAGGGWAGLPLSTPKPDPKLSRPDNIHEDEEARSEYKEWARGVYDYNAKTVAKRKSALSKIRTAAAYLDQPEFFFPWQLDYRGRGYPVSGDLHPQSDDVARGLLEFSEGKVLNEEGARWLMIKLANHFGQDKGMSFDDRVKWVMDHATQIMCCAAEPLEHKWWVGADDPWQALATIFELDVVLRMGDTWPLYVSHLPVNLDGTCNGLQHFAAMGLDTEAARMVNLLPSATPSDIYEKVAKKVTQVVQVDSQRIPIDAQMKRGRNRDGKIVYWPTPHPSHHWLGNVTRKTVKRAAMTMPYGVTLEGMADQFVTDGHTEEMPNPRSCAVYLRDVTWAVLKETQPAARAIMDWLKKVSGKTAKKDVALRWDTPIGFPVIQEALEYRQTAIYTLLQRVHIHMGNDEGKISVHRQNRCMPPNFVHSLDAAHMMLTVIAAAKRGITSFNMIHDSFGCHACDVPVMAKVLRDQFIRMYAFDDVLERYRLAWQGQSGVDLPDPPKRGNLDIVQVYNSSYFFG